MRSNRQIQQTIGRVYCKLFELDFDLANVALTMLL